MFDNTNYAYSVAKVRVMETKLLKRSDFERMLDMESANEVFKFLLDKGFGESGDGSSSSNYESLLTEEMKKTYNFLKKIAPQPEIFDIFLYRNDILNTKVILKSEFMGLESETSLVDMGTISVQNLKIMIKDREFSKMHPLMKDGIMDVLDNYAKTSDPQQVDLILDKTLYKMMILQAETSKSEFVISLIKAYIDLENMKAFVRVKNMGKNLDFLSKVLLDGGTIEKDFYIRKFSDSLESFMEAVSHTNYKEAVGQGIESYLESNSVTRLEKLTQDLITKKTGDAKYVALGIEPLVAYLLSKETEILNVRIVMVGKVNGIDSDVIKERLRVSYA